MTCDRIEDATELAGFTVGVDGADDYDYYPDDAEDCYQNCVDTTEFDCKMVEYLATYCEWGEGVDFIEEGQNTLSLRFCLFPTPNNNSTSI